MKEIRLLNADEIECRVGTLKQDGSGCSLLLYKDARVDMKILDETYGTNNWQRTHEVINGNLFCNIDIWDDEKKVWVRKQDVGVESYTEKQKGEASDSFKRAGFNIGIGRELYTSPFIWIKLNGSDTYTKNNKVTLKTSFKVKEITYKNRMIDKLMITDQDNVIRFQKGYDSTEEQMKEYLELQKKVPGFNKQDFDEWVFKNYKVKNVSSLSRDNMDKILGMLRSKVK